MSDGDGQVAALIAETMAAISHMPGDRVRVTGDGALAQLLRDRGLDGDAVQPPLAVIETTGRGPELTAACAEVADGGTVVLAADAPEPLDIDLYRDVHRRGLVLIGVSGQGALPGAGVDSLAAGG
jgi:hypothetical protein